MVAVVLAVLIIIAAIGRLMLARVVTRAEGQIVHEVEKFRDFAEHSDLVTEMSDVTVADVLKGHLEQNPAEEDEFLFTLVNSSPYQRSAAEPIARLDQDSAFVAHAGALEAPELGRWNTTKGPAIYGVVPIEVQGTPDKGHLVIVEFLQEDYDEAYRFLWLMAFIGAFALGGALLIGWFITGRVLAPIRELQTTAARISEEELDRRIDVVGNDDVARLAQTFNHMLDRLSVAFAGQRQFLDDVGHELRTPLTIIRGHLELMGDDPREQRATMALVDDELQRMGRLVDDLILLARAERPDFLQLHLVNLTDVVVETFAKATALADREWVLDELPDVRAVVDSERITQALLQLAANAVSHTAAGAVIALGGNVQKLPSGTHILLWVRDEGQGIELEEQPRIFQRFVRTENESGAGSSSGLGLAIVRGIAEAHAGRVDVVSKPGHGATFTLELPFRESS